jgi:hypothetical protein
MPKEIKKESGRASGSQAKVGKSADPSARMVWFDNGVSPKRTPDGQGTAVIRQGRGSATN